jgi:hypothetical protein
MKRNREQLVHLLFQDTLAPPSLQEARENHSYNLYDY